MYNFLQKKVCFRISEVVGTLIHRDDKSQSIDFLDLHLFFSNTWRWSIEVSWDAQTSFTKERKIQLGFDFPCSFGWSSSYSELTISIVLESYSVDPYIAPRFRFMSGLVSPCTTQKSNKLKKSGLKFQFLKLRLIGFTFIILYFSM